MPKIIPPGYFEEDAFKGKTTGNTGVSVKFDSVRVSLVKCSGLVCIIFGALGIAMLVTVPPLDSRKKKYKVALIEPSTTLYDAGELSLER